MAIKIPKGRHLVPAKANRIDVAAKLTFCRVGKFARLYPHRLGVARMDKKIGIQDRRVCTHSYVRNTRAKWRLRPQKKAV
jgi:hypothetical protein